MYRLTIFTTEHLLGVNQLTVQGVNKEIGRLPPILEFSYYYFLSWGGGGEVGGGWGGGEGG